MPPLALTAIEEAACGARATRKRETIDTRHVDDEDEVTSLNASSSLDSMRGSTRRGYWNGRSQSAEKV
jgi:hypothetical protein